MPGLGHRVVEIAGCAVSSLVRRVSVMTSETLVRAGTRGKLVVLKARVRSKGRGLAGPGRSLVSTALTSTLHRRCTPKKNRRIPTICAGRVDAGLVHVSAVDTGPRRSESGVLGGTARRLRHRSPPPPAQGPGGQGSTPAPPRVGLLHEGRDPLTTGCAYCTKAPPTRSTPNPPPVAPHPRAVHPDDTGSHAVDADNNNYRLPAQPRPPPWPATCRQRGGRRRSAPGRRPTSTRPEGRGP